MRKLFLLIPILAFALMANAAEIPVSEGTKTLYTAYNNAEAGSTLVLAAGTYNETERIEFTKSMTIKAADGAEVIVKTSKDNPLTLGAEVKFIGIKFDGSAMGTREYFIRSYDATAGNELHFENCELYNFPSTAYLINAASNERSLDSIIINNCYFLNNGNDVIYVNGTTASKGIIVKNSTFANSSANHSIIEVRNGGSDPTDDIELIVDHCTFYNNTFGDGDYSNIRTYKLNRSYITNCIFAHSTAYAKYAAYAYGGTIYNCLNYNLTSNYRNWSPCATFSGNTTGDPLFNDLANNRYTYAGNWVTMELSPARGAATDGSDLGDPRWYSAETLPSTNFASAYVFLGTKAQLSGSFALNGDNYIQSQDKDYDGIAKWKIEVTRKCVVEVTLNIADANTSGHRYEVALYDADNNIVGTALAEPDNSWSHGDKVLGTLDIPAAGNYTVKLTNDCDNSSTIIEGVTFTYAGGAIIPVSPSVNTTLNVADAWFSGCTRDDGKTYIQYPSSETSSAWIKWNIATTETKYYDLTLNINAPNAHGLTVAIYEDEAAAPIESVTEGSYVSSTGDLALELGRVNLVGGKNYVVKVTNSPSGSVAKIINLVFAPVVATVTALPATLNFNDAVLSARAQVTDGKLYFAPIGDANPVGEWASWAVTTDHDGLFLFTMGVNSDNGQSYRITILDDGDNVVDFCDFKTSTGAQTLKHYFQLSAGNYSVKVENTTAWSHGYLTSFAITEPSSIITMNEEDAGNDAWVGNVVAKEAAGPLYDVQIIRTLRAGMYNTFCLPFEVTSNETKEIFGLDIEIYTLETAVVTDNILYVTLHSESDIYPGTPVFIKPSHDIANPIFDDVKFTVATPSSTTRVNANFAGTFVKSTLEPDQNILYLGMDNTLYYPEVSTQIRGMRGWFVIHDAPVPAPSIRQMSIVEKKDNPTNISLIEANGNETRKMIINGQLIIIRDGVRYNAMGTRIE